MCHGLPESSPLTFGDNGATRGTCPFRGAALVKSRTWYIALYCRYLLCEGKFLLCVAERLYLRIPIFLRKPAVIFVNNIVCWSWLIRNLSKNVIRSSTVKNSRVGTRLFLCLSRVINTWAHLGIGTHLTCDLLIWAVASSPKELECFLGNNLGLLSGKNVVHSRPTLLDDFMLLIDMAF